jgi:AcrR family transcriptional regulator
MPARPRTTPRKTPRQDRSKATVDAILDATARVLLRHGYDRASTNRVATEAGVSIGSLYQYFPSKEALVAAVIERHSERSCAGLQEKMQEVAAEPIPVVVRELVSALIQAKQVEPKLHKVLIEQIPRVGRLSRVKEMEARVGEMLRVFFEARRAEIRPANLDAAVFTLVTLGVALSHGIAIDRPEHLSERELVDEFTEIVCRYLIPFPSERTEPSSRASRDRVPLKLVPGEPPEAPPRSEA